MELWSGQCPGNCSFFESKGYEESMRIQGFSNDIVNVFFHILSEVWRILLYTFTLAVLNVVDDSQKSKTHDFLLIFDDFPA